MGGARPSVAAREGQRPRTTREARGLTWAVAKRAGRVSIVLLSLFLFV